MVGRPRADSAASASTCAPATDGRRQTDIDKLRQALRAALPLANQEGSNDNGSASCFAAGKDNSHADRLLADLRQALGGAGRDSQEALLVSRSNSGKEKGGGGGGGISRRESQEFRRQSLDSNSKDGGSQQRPTIPPHRRSSTTSAGGGGGEGGGGCSLEDLCFLRQLRQALNSDGLPTEMPQLACARRHSVCLPAALSSVPTTPAVRHRFVNVPAAGGSVVSGPAAYSSHCAASPQSARVVRASSPQPENVGALSPSPPRSVRLQVGGGHMSPGFPPRPVLIAFASPCRPPGATAAIPVSSPSLGVTPRELFAAPKPLVRMVSCALPTTTAVLTTTTTTTVHHVIRR